MAIYHQLKEMEELQNRLNAVYGDKLTDTESGKTTSWHEIFNKVRFGRDWEIHPDFIKEQQIIGGIPEIYFIIGEGLLKRKPYWLEGEKG